MNTPDKWVIIKIDDFYKVFATWHGGYLGGDEWRLNSGIAKVEQDDNFYYFHGHSGSIYKCHKKAYGTSRYSQSILNHMIDISKEKATITVMSGGTDFMSL